MTRPILLAAILFCAFNQANAQDTALVQKKERLDFAMNYFEFGGTFMPSFTGKSLGANGVKEFTNSASVMQYLNWGGMHFWGHGEFYVTFPLRYQPFEKNEETNAEFFHSVVTGARFYPWVYREQKLTPYIGANWSAVSFQQVEAVDNTQPILSKDFMLAFDAGVLFGYKRFAMRLGMNYLPNTTWDYPISRTQKASLKTPNIGLQLGLLYTMDLTNRTTEENIENWNKIQGVSKMTLHPKTKTDFYIAAGPSLSFSLQESTYNRTELPFLNARLSSSTYFDLAVGVQSNKLGLFSALSFRNPAFTAEGFGTKQTIKKTSLTLELNKFIVDYNGFAPFIGLNVAYDNLTYSEATDGDIKELNFEGTFEPGLSFGWDIVPGKTQEALVLRTNLRWYPMSSFEVDNTEFVFPQLEYNLIQVVFYPGRLKNMKKKV